MEIYTNAKPFARVLVLIWDIEWWVLTINPLFSECLLFLTEYIESCKERAEKSGRKQEFEGESPLPLWSLPSRLIKSPSHKIHINCIFRLHFLFDEVPSQNIRNMVIVFSVVNPKAKICDKRLIHLAGFLDYVCQYAYTV